MIFRFGDNNGNLDMDKEIRIGADVKVKEGIMCPDMEGLEIGGWQGKIIEIVDNLVCIEWDDKTLDDMPNYFIEQSEEEGLEHKLMYLYINEVEKINFQMYAI